MKVKKNWRSCSRGKIWDDWQVYFWFVVNIRIQKELLRMFKNFFQYKHA